MDAAAPNTLESRCAAALLARPSGSIISHHTAAAVRGLPAPKWAEIQVTVPGRTAPRVAGVRAHLGAEGAPVETYGGLPITPRPRLWLDLAAELGRVELIVLGDAILRPVSVTLEDLQAALDAAGGRRGVQLARAVLPYLERRVDSPQETRLRMILIDGGLPRPVVNRPAAGGCRTQRTCSSAPRIPRTRRTTAGSLRGRRGRGAGPPQRAMTAAQPGRRLAVDDSECQKLLAPELRG